MKIRKGLQKLGNMKSAEILIDWDYVTKDHGLRKETQDFQILLGRILRFFSITGIIALILVDATLGNFTLVEAMRPSRIGDVFFWGGVLVLVYSFYLLRDRTKYIDTLEIKDLDSLRAKDIEEKLPQKIEIADYFDYDILNVLDDAVYKDREFLSNLLSMLYELPKVRLLTDRLNISDKSYQSIVKKAYENLNTSQDTWMERLMFESFVLAYKNSFSSIDEQVMFLTIAVVALKDILLDVEVLPTELNGLLLWANNEAKKKRYKKLWKEKASLKPKNSVNRSFTSRFAVTLERYKRDFTLEVLQGDFSISIARDELMDDLIRLLKQGEKGAVIIKGPPGVGKTTFLKNLAVRMAVEDVPRELYDKRLVGFDFNKAFAVSTSNEMLRQKVEKVFEEVANAKNIVLVLDDIDRMVDSSNAGDVITIIVDAIEKYKIRVVATSSDIGFNKNIGSKRGLVSRFDVIEMNEPLPEVAMQILIDEVPKLEKKYKTKISFDAIKRAVGLADKYDFDRVLPEKGIDLIEEAVVFAKEKGIKFIGEGDIEEVISKKVGVKVGTLDAGESQKLIHIEEEMHKRVVGQHEAIKSVASALRRAGAGLTKENRPISSFLFFGPTGVGKTEVAKTLAAAYYGSSDLMIRLDMSEYHEDENLKRLIGYTEGDEFFGGFLTEAVRERPYSLILLDELEKANPRVLDLFLQILDEGIVTDGMGRKVNFENTIIIATSNAGSKIISESVERGEEYKMVFKKAIPELRRVYRVEFLNRFDRVIMFKPLLQTEIEQVAAIMMQKLVSKLYEKGIVVDFSHELLRELAHVGYNPVYGARELNRIIQETVEDKIATLMLEGKLQSGKKLLIKSLKSFEVVEG
ncbi:MAG TPA: ATP-dependent Clp protease ATP-binding subunit [Candidatus Dojkabacteria bacterium]|jgi:ATP-dependent Clp protease ATP-binding subunit ClpA